MIEKLDSYRPSLEMMLGIKHQLLRAGIAEEDIPAHWLEAIIAAHEKWLLTTEDGMEHFRRLFCFDGQMGEDDKVYTLVDNVQRTMVPVNKKDIWMFDGVLVGGRPVPLADPMREGPTPAIELEIVSIDKNKCDGCGTISHCILEILDPLTERTEELCNYCVTYHEHPRVNDHGGLKTCELCSVQSCKHHPARLRA